MTERDEKIIVWAFIGCVGLLGIGLVIGALLHTLFNYFHK
jgi:hypothetical protein